MAEINPLSKDYTRYFIYSMTQMKIKRDIEYKLGRDLVLGKVIVGGVQKEYTEIVSDLADVTESDAKIVAYGDIREMNYTEPNWKGACIWKRN